MLKANFPGSPYVRWDLFILPGGNDSGKIWVASGDQAGEATLSLDTTQYPNGEHAFSLRLVKADSNYDEQIVKFTSPTNWQTLAIPALLSGRKLIETSRKA